MVNSFKGALAELLALKPCIEIFKQLKEKNILPPNSKLYIGDIVYIKRKKGNGFLKGADMYILLDEPKLNNDSTITVAGVIEVKSYTESRRKLNKQLDLHVTRSKRGLSVNGLLLFRYVKRP